MYKYLLFIHVLMAIVWVGGGLAIQVLAFRILKEDDGPRLAALGADASFMGQFIFTPASLILLLAGIGMVVDAWSFSDTWIIIGLVGWFATLVTGAFFLGPEAKRMSVIAAERGANDPEVQAKVRRLLAISRIDAVVLVLIVADMTIKPGL